MPKSKQRVCYFYEPEIGSFYYGQYHPMKPHRIRMTHDLLLNYNLYQKMEVYVRVDLRVHRGATVPRSKAARLHAAAKRERPGRVQSC